MSENIVSLPAYQSLINDRVSWLSQSWGDVNNRAIAFIPHKNEPDAQKDVQKCINLFANYDPRPRDCWGEFPAPPKACNYHDITYINVSEERLLQTLVNYFESALPKSMGNVVYTNELSEGGPDIDFVYDVDEVKKVALECANYFISNHIQVRCFIPERRNFAPDEYGVSFSRKEDLSPVEDYASAVG
jgi:hypothetical protein